MNISASTPRNKAGLMFITNFRRYLLLSCLLFLPLYYSKEAKNIYRLYLPKNATRSRPSDNATLNTMGDSPSLSTNQNNIIQLVAIMKPAETHPRYHWTPLSNPYIPSTNTSASLDSSSLSREHAKRLQSKWCSYVESRYAEWIFIISVASVIIVAFPAIMQMPGINGNPMARCFTFLAVLRAVPAIVHGSLLLFYFRQMELKDARFAAIWLKYSQQDSFPSCMPWTILALPAVSLGWGIVFLFVALFSYIWQVDQPPISVAQTQPFRINVALPTIVTAVAVLDLACVIWFAKILKMLKSKASESVPAR